MDSSERAALVEKCSRFAEVVVAAYPDLHRADEFPAGLWQRMGEEGLFTMGIDKATGGAGGGYALLAEAGEAFVRKGRNLGMALSWLYQQLVARFLLQGFGTQAQRQCLKLMAQGRLTASLAVSEPGHGSHPKFLSTDAKRDGSSYILNGEKTYLTNGPIAGLFIVIAATGGGETRKRFTVFLVARETAGLTVTPPMALPFLRPAPHGGITLSDCRVAEETILGEIDKAYEEIVIPFGQIEDLVMAGAVAGGLAAQVGILTDLLRQRPVTGETSVLQRLGALTSGMEAARVLIAEAMARLDRGEPPSAPIALMLPKIWADIQNHLDAITAESGISAPQEYDLLKTDLTALLSIRGKGLRAKQAKLGLSVLKGPS